jgi:hypothetical protein
VDDVEPCDARRPGARGQESRQHVHGGGLAGAVRAEETVDLAGGHSELDAVDGADAALELAREAARLDAVLVTHARQATEKVDVVKYLRRQVSWKR